jgi:hypothetical protein
LIHKKYIRNFIFKKIIYTRILILYQTLSDSQCHSIKYLSKPSQVHLNIIYKCHISFTRMSIHTARCFYESSAIIWWKSIIRSIHCCWRYCSIYCRSFDIFGFDVHVFLRRKWTSKWTIHNSIIIETYESISQCLSWNRSWIIDWSLFNVCYSRFRRSNCLSMFTNSTLVCTGCFNWSLIADFWSSVQPLFEFQ